MNRRIDLPTRRDMVVKETDARGNPRHLIVVDEPQHTEIVEMPDVQLPARPTANRVGAVVQGSYQDRARAFSHVTLNLSLVTGVGLVVAAMVLGDGVTFAALTGYFFTGFCVVWLASFALHTFVSPEGVDLFESWQLWRFIAREQEERHLRQRYQYQYVPQRQRRTALALSMLTAGVVLVGLYMYQMWGV